MTDEPYHMDVCITLIDLPPNADINDVLRDIENAVFETPWKHYIAEVREDF